MILAVLFIICAIVAIVGALPTGHPNPLSPWYQVAMAIMVAIIGWWLHAASFLRF